MCVDVGVCVCDRAYALTRCRLCLVSTAGCGSLAQGGTSSAPAMMFVCETNRKTADGTGNDFRTGEMCFPNPPLNHMWNEPFSIFFKHCVKVC